MLQHTPRNRGKRGFVNQLEIQAHGTGSASSKAKIHRLRQQALKRFKVAWTQEMRDAFLPAFPQARTANRAIEVLKGMLFTTIGGTIADSVRARSREQEDPSADMRVLSRMQSPQVVYEGVFRATCPLLPIEGPVVLAVDDTVLPKRGKKMDFVRACHNPLAPPWQPFALMPGHSVFHAALIVTDKETMKPLAITVAFELVEPRPKALRKKKGGRGKTSGSNRKKKTKKTGSRSSKRKRGRPTKEEAARNKQEEQAIRRRYPTAPDVAVATITRVRKWMDEAGMKDRLLLVAGDGSYTNATVFFRLPERCQYVGRVRPDASLETIGRRRGTGFQYGPKAQKPFEMATDKYYPARQGRFLYGADHRLLKFKEVGPVTRKNSTKKLQLRLLLLRPSSYLENGERRYSHEAFLLTVDNDLPAEVLIQAYLARWSIEVNHRNAKTNAKVGKSQVRKAKSITKVHPALAAAFALLWVSVLKVNGGSARTALFAPQAIWQRKHFEWRSGDRRKKGKAEPVQRASAVDVLTFFREAFFDRWRDGLPRASAD